MRDLVLIAHVLIGIGIMLSAILVLLNLKSSKKTVQIYATIAAILSWLVLLPSAILYLVFYPATKTVIKAGSWPWAHTILMEAKEHIGLLLPLISTVGVVYVCRGKIKESRKWWILLAVTALLLGIMGRVIKIGALK